MPKKRKATTGVRRRRRTTRFKAPATRFLFAHPSWLRNRWLPNAEKHGTAGMITGVLNVYVEKPGDDKDSFKHHDECKERCEALGWRYVPGVRFSHQTRSQWKFLLDPEPHWMFAEKAKAWGGICLDMEPYGIKTGQRYHGREDAHGLFEAAYAWATADVPVYVYPPMFRAPYEILRRASQSFALDHTTYNAKRHEDIDFSLSQRESNWRYRGINYVPGFYLRYLNSAKYMEAATAYHRCFFFPQIAGGRDNYYKLFTPEWAPEEV